MKNQTQSRSFLFFLLWGFVLLATALFFGSRVLKEMGLFIPLRENPLEFMVGTFVFAILYAAVARFIVQKRLEKRKDLPG